MAVKINISKICIISSFVVMIFGILAYSYQKTVKIENSFFRPYRRN